MCVEARGIWEISVLSSQFYCKPKTALKNKVFNEKNIYKHDQFSLVYG